MGDIEAKPKVVEGPLTAKCNVCDWTLNMEPIPVSSDLKEFLKLREKRGSDFRDHMKKGHQIEIGHVPQASGGT